MSLREFEEAEHARWDFGLAPSYADDDYVEPAWDEPSPYDEGMIWPDPMEEALRAYERRQAEEHDRWEAEMELRRFAFSMPGHEGPGFVPYPVEHPRRRRLASVRLSTIVVRRYEFGETEWVDWVTPCFYTWG